MSSYPLDPRNPHEEVSMAFQLYVMERIFDELDTSLPVDICYGASQVFRCHYPCRANTHMTMR